MANSRVRKAKQEVRYALRSGVRTNGVDAETLSAALDHIQAANGTVTPELMLEYATPPDSPIHKALTWDNKRAGHQWRLQECRMLIRAVVTVSDSTPLMVYVGRDEGYQPVETVIRQQDWYAAALSHLQAKFSSASEAMHQLEAAAKKSPDSDKDRLAKITVALRAVDVAGQAISALH